MEVFLWIILLASIGNTLASDFDGFSENCWMQHFWLTCKLDNIPNNYFAIGNSSTKKLQFKTIKINKIENQAFNGLTQLEDLHLYNNEITELPNEVFQSLANLREIHLDGNKLTTINIDQFIDNPKLQNLHLFNNSITTIEPNEDTNISISIKTLDLSSNKLMNISAICKLKELTHLYLSNNPNLNFDSFNISCWSKLEVLSLATTNMKQSDFDKQSFADLNNLWQLELRNNSLEIFPGVDFPNLPKLSNMMISGNKLRTLNVTIVKSKFGKLRQIRLGGNPWDCEHIEQMKREFNETTTIQDIKDLTCISYNDVTTKVQPDELEISYPFIIGFCLLVIDVIISCCIFSELFHM